MQDKLINFLYDYTAQQSAEHVTDWLQIPLAPFHGLGHLYRATFRLQRTLRRSLSSYVVSYVYARSSRCIRDFR